MTPGLAKHTIFTMSDKLKYDPSAELASLEAQLQELLQICKQLKGENSSLRLQQNSLISERASLIEKNEMARSRVEAMITRLKSMENSQ